MENDKHASMKEIGTATFSDIDKAISVLDYRIKCYSSEKRMFGKAKVISCRNDFLNVMTGLKSANVGDILVIDASGSDRAVLGGLFCTEAARRGLSGVIVDGLIRDISIVRNVKIPIFARGACPCAGTVKNDVKVNDSVWCGGVLISNNDCILSDEDGIIAAPEESFENMFQKAQDLYHKEINMIKKINEGTSLFELVEIDQFIDKENH